MRYLLLPLLPFQYLLVQASRALITWKTFRANARLRRIPRMQVLAYTASPRMSCQLDEHREAANK